MGPADSRRAAHTDHNRKARARVLDETPRDRLLILTNEAGEPLSVEWLSKGLKKWARKAGVREELRLYDARGACVTRLVMAEASLSQIAAHMGWGLGTAAKMIETYAAMDPDFSDAVLVKLDDMRNKIVNRAVNRGASDTSPTD